MGMGIWGWGWGWERERGGWGCAGWKLQFVLEEEEGGRVGRWRRGDYFWRTSETENKLWRQFDGRGVRKARKKIARPEIW